MISLGFQAPYIIAAIVSKSDQDFKSSVSILKSAKFQFNPGTKQWRKHAALYTENLYDLLRIGTEVYFPEPIKDLIVKYPETLPSELEKFEQISQIEYTALSNFRPIVGKAPFENFQDTDIRRALQQNRFLFNWTTGCGKSFATSIIYEYLRKNRNIEKMILFTSAIGTYNLRNELSKFCIHIKDEDVAVFNSAKSFKKTRAIFDDEEVQNKHVLVFSYDSWKLITKAYGDSEKGKKLNVPLTNFFKDQKDWLICFDECQYLSNPKSGRSKSILKYLKYFKYRYLFSATPADKPEKLYSVCTILDPKLVRLLNYGDWLSKYNDIGTFFSKYAINKKAWHWDEIDKLNEELTEYSVKRSYEVLDLPDHTVQHIEIDMSEKQRELYKMFTTSIIQTCLSNKKDSIKDTTVALIRYAFTLMTSFCENPNILGNSNSEIVSDVIKKLCNKYNYNKDYAKLDTIDAILDDEVSENENRGIIWYIHPATKDEVAKRYEKLNPIIISAELSETERDKLLKEFKTDAKHKIIIASQNILATSVTLTECSFAIYLETSFSYETYYQSAGRIYRIGQTQPVRIYHIWLKQSTDMYHKKAIEAKHDLVNMLFSKTKPKFTALSQIKDLFMGKLDDDL